MSLHSEGQPRNPHPAMPKGVPAPGPWDLPGDNVNLDNEGLAEGMHPFIRMGTIVRARRLDLRILLDAYDMHQRGFIDVNTFQRALAYSFGEQWNELQLTTAEFEEVRAPPTPQAVNAGVRRESRGGRSRRARVQLVKSVPGRMLVPSQS